MCELGLAIEGNPVLLILIFCCGCELTLFAPPPIVLTVLLDPFANKLALPDEGVFGVTKLLSSIDRGRKGLLWLTGTLTPPAPPPLKATLLSDDRESDWAAVDGGFWGDGFDFGITWIVGVSTSFSTNLTQSSAIFTE